MVFLIPSRGRMLLVISRLMVLYSILLAGCAVQPVGQEPGTTDPKPPAGFDRVAFAAHLKESCFAGTDAFEDAILRNRFNAREADYLWAHYDLSDENEVGSKLGPCLQQLRTRYEMTVDEWYRKPPDFQVTARLEQFIFPGGCGFVTWASVALYSLESGPPGFPLIFHVVNYCPEFDVGEWFRTHPDGPHLRFSPGEFHRLTLFESWWGDQPVLVGRFEAGLPRYWSREVELEEASSAGRETRTNWALEFLRAKTVSGPTR